MIISNVFKRLLCHSGRTGAIEENNFLSSISILKISVETHEVSCEQYSMRRPIANGRPRRSRSRSRSRAKTDRQSLQGQTNLHACMWWLWQYVSDDMTCHFMLCRSQYDNIFNQNDHSSIPPFIFRVWDTFLIILSFSWAEARYLVISKCDFCCSVTTLMIHGRIER
jgi:hypothetical protein